MKKIYVVFCLLVFSSNLQAQTAEDSVKAVINKMFTAMKNADVGALKECFADSAILQTVTRSGNIRTDAVSSFLSQVSTLKKDSADERIQFETVKVDDGLAIAWTPYKFYYAGNFSHCGVNSFQLVRSNGNWRIQYLIDTRRRVNCN